MADTTDSPPRTGQRLIGEGGILTVINLPERRDRRAAFARQLARIGLSLDDPRVQLLPGIRPDTAGGFPGIGARGCFLSHLAALRLARDRGANRLVLCEDDLDFAPDFTARAPAILSGMDGLHWDIVQAGHIGLPGRVDTGSGLVPIAPDTAFLGAHFMLFRGSILDDLVRYLEAMLDRPAGSPLGGPMHVDGAYNHFRRDRPDLAAFIVVPPLGNQRRSRSDITSRHLIDRVPILRGLADLLRRLRSP